MKIVLPLVTMLLVSFFSHAQNSYSVAVDPNPCAPYNVTFTPNVGANVGIIQYDLGIGGPPQTDFSLAPVTYSYPADGTYWTTATFYDLNGNFINSSSQQVVISGFNYFITTNAAFQNPINSPISFEINTMDNINSVSWDFGDGNTSSGSATTHAYSSAGSYTVTATVDTESCGVITLTNEVDVIDLSVAVTGSPCTPAEITLTATSNDPNVAFYQFLTPAGNSPISASNEFQVTFTTPGIKNFSVVTFDNAQNQIGQLEDQIEIFANDYTVTTNLAGNQSLIDYEVEFSLNSGVGSPTVPANLSWDLGDGTTSSDLNPSHIYTAFGNYNVYAIYENSCGVIDSVEFALEVSPMDVAFPNDICVGEPTTFEYIGPIITSTIEWEFIQVDLQIGNGGFNPVPDVTQTFTNGGLYLGKVLIWNSTFDQVISEYEFYFNVNDPNVTNTSATSCGTYYWNGVEYTQSGVYTASACNETFTLDLTIIPAYTYELNIEECSEYSDPNFGYFDQSGVYTFEYTSVDGCDSNYVLNITIHPIPQAPTIELGSNNELIASGGDTYNWYNCEDMSAPLVGINGSVLLGQTGHFAASIVSEEGCESGFSTCLFTENDEDPLGTTEANYLPIKVYPNPATTSVTIAEIAQPSSIIITDINGRVMYTSATDATLLEIALDNFASGVYLVNVVSEQFKATQKLIVK